MVAATFAVPTPPSQGAQAQALYNAQQTAAAELKLARKVHMLALALLDMDTNACGVLAVACQACAERPEPSRVAMPVAAVPC
jgi:hypothetical protein